MSSDSPVRLLADRCLRNHASRIDLLNDLRCRIQDSSDRQSAEVAFGRRPIGVTAAGSMIRFAGIERIQIVLRDGAEVDSLFAFRQQIEKLLDALGYSQPPPGTGPRFICAADMKWAKS